MHPAGITAGIESAEAQEQIAIGPDQTERVIQRSQALTALERLEIYSNAYYARLLECLREEFPVLVHALTQEVFDAFAVAYLQKYPSRSYTLVQLGARFPQFLAETRPLEDEKETTFSRDAESPERSANSPDLVPATWTDFIVDLATLERTISEVFDGPGPEREPPLDPDHLKSISAERLMQARLVGVPCLRLLELGYPVQRYFTAVRRKENPALPEPARTYLAITRRHYVVRHYELSQAAYQLLRALLEGKSPGQAISDLLEAPGTDPDHLYATIGRWFHNWTAEGFFRSVELA